MNSRELEGEPVIVIDDDETMRRACREVLSRAGYAVETFANGESGLRRIEEIGSGLIIVDLKMPGMSGMEVIERVKRINPDAVLIVITGFATVGTAVEAMQRGAYDFIPKPFTAEELRVIIARGLERYRLAVEAKRLRKEKETSARKFITFVSHQLQSPLGAVQQYLDVLRHQLGDDLPERHREWIERSRMKIVEMLQIIGDWLTMSKVEAGQLATQWQPLRWQDIAPQVLESFTGTATDNQVTVRNELPPALPAVIGDAAALRMLLSNLVANAVQYNHPGGEVIITGETDQGKVTLSVTDTGIGIAPEDCDRVFEEFYRVAGEGAAVRIGTGMGLPICTKIAGELGGGITLRSRFGEGSTFSVVLPRAPGNGPSDS